jgi:excisionase family DNA binding protein
MNLKYKTKKPTKEEQRIAIESYNALDAVLENLHSPNTEIIVEETQEKIEIPVSALKLLVKILKATGEGKPISIVPIETEMTTQVAAELLGCSRPHFVKLLESGKISFVKIGKHRRVMMEDVVNYKNLRKSEQKKIMGKIMQSDEELGLYDS